MSTTELSSYQSARSSLSPSQAFGLVLDSAVSTVAGRLVRTTAGWIDRLSASTDRHHSSAVGTELADAGLDAAADSGGVARRAGAEGVKAHLHGRSPAWAAVRTAWQAGSPAVRAAMVTSAVGAVVLLLLSPALALVYLLSWLVIAAVSRSRADRQPDRAATRP